MSFINWIKNLFGANKKSEHLIYGKIGEDAAREHLKKKGLKFITSNYRSPRGEIDLIFRDGDCLVFVEVKTRSSEEWTRPSKAVDTKKRRIISLAALDYIKQLQNPRIKFRFDIVEVILHNGEVDVIRHLPASFTLSKPLKFG